MYSYKILEQSRQNILTLADVKNYIRISTDNDDNLLGSMMNAAIQVAENFMKISLVKKVIEVESENAMNIKLPYAPVIEITHVIVDETEVNLDDIKVYRDVLSFSKYLKCTKLKITYLAGYPDASLVPVSILQGIMLHVSSMYDSRGGGAVYLGEIFALYQPYRRIEI